MKVEWLERPCPLCGSRAEARLFAESNVDLEKLDGFAFASRKLPEYMHHRLGECTCGMLYSNPVLTVDTLAGAYEAADFDSGDEASFASATYAAHVRRIMPSLPDRRGTLDIGAGDGVFLDALLKLGFEDVQGVEPSKAPVAAAKPHIRPLIKTGFFRAEDFPARSFSLVTCFQTMEHVSSPLETSQAAWQLLKPKGAFLIVVHNRKSLSAKILGMKSPIFDIEHLQLFCPSTARQLLERAGFERVSVRPLWNRYPLHYWMKLFPLPAGFKRSVLPGFRRSWLGKTVVPLPAGNLICVGFKP